MTIRTIAPTLMLAAALIAPAFAQTPAPRAPATPRTVTPTAPPAAPAAPGEPAPPVPPPAPPAAGASSPAASVPIRRRVGQPVNIKIDVTITDQNGAAPAVKKTVAVVTADGLMGRIRSTANYRAIGNTPLNVDAEPEILSDGKIRVRVNLQYSLPGNIGTGQPDAVSGAGPLLATEIQENLSLVLESGKPIIAAQSADPVGDRQVTIEVKATILK